MFRSTPRVQGLSEEEIRKLLDESDCEVSDADDPDYTPSAESNLGRFEHVEVSDCQDEQNDGQDEQNDSVHDEGHESSCIRDMIWKKARLPAVSIKEENGEEETEVDTRRTPYEYFMEYFRDDFWTKVVDESNLYSMQQRSKPLKATKLDILKLVGMQIVMGTIKYPQARMYWASATYFPLIADAMKRDRFFELRNNLHFIDNLQQDETNGDKLKKVRLILDEVQRRCLLLPRPSHLSLDEQMIPFSGICVARQYVPSKPNPLGLKNFVLAAKDGLILDFLIYQGKNTINAVDSKEFGLAGSVVKHLMARFQSGTYSLYIDRFFSGIKIVKYLLSHGIYCTGTVMGNRLGGLQKKLKNEKHMSRGDHDERVSKSLAVVKWLDSKVVLTLSSAHGSEPTGKVKRWCKKEKKEIVISRPAVIESYNKYMGGVDLHDRYISYYRSAMRTRRWPVRVFSHFIDLSIVNSWVLYMRHCTVNNIPRNKILTLIEFRMYIGKALINKAENIVVSPSVGRPRKQDEVKQTEVTNKRRHVVSVPESETRYDGYKHWPKHVKGITAQRCRLTGCKGQTRVMCLRCNVYLCLQSNDCFIQFHEKN